jgi:putative aldouronate transport system permease protein
MQISSERRSLIKRNWELYLFILPAMIFYIIFHYIPMYGVQIAFKNYMVTKGIFGSPWAGFKHFERFFNSYQFWTLLRNTVVLSFYQILAGFPIPIILALLLNQIKNQSYKKIIQTVTYAPHFISVVVLVGMVNIFLSPRSGIINHIIDFLGGDRVFFMADPAKFRHIFVWSGIWKNAGYSMIIYLAALSGIDPQLHEAAIVDGASKLQRIRHIEIPGIIPTATILLIMNVGRVMQIGFERAYLMQNPLNLETSEIIATYVYKVGLLSAQFSFSAAVGLFNSLINMILLISVNRVAKTLTSTSLW